VEISKYPDGQRGMKTWFYEVHGGGHAWPGRPGYLPEKTIGKATQTFNASDVIAQFFKGCPKRASAAAAE
jgi:poly(3-hydroxybutyrate) depolymerase